MRWSGSEQVRTMMAVQAQQHGLRVLKVLLAFANLRRLVVKSGFRETQLRWPRGSGDVSGEWREEGRRKEGDRVAAIEVYLTRRPPSVNPKTPPRSPRLRTPSPGIGHNGGPPLEELPKIPKERPLKAVKQSGKAVRSSSKSVKQPGYEINHIFE